MNRRMRGILMALLLLFSLSGCSAYRAWEKLREQDSSSPPPAGVSPAPSSPASSSRIPASDSEKVSGPELPETGGTPQPDPLDFPDESALRELLEGTWTYCPPASDVPAAWIMFSGDGSFVLRIQDPLDGAVLEEAGFCQLGYWNAWEGEAPDMMSLLFSDGSGGPISGLVSCVGDFLIRQKTLCDGEVILELLQLNNGDGVFSLYFYDAAPVLKKYTGWQPQGEIRRSETFDALAWKADLDTRTIWLDDGTAAGGYYNEGRYESLPYRAAPQLDLASLPPQLLNGGAWTVRTDETGQVVDMQPHIVETITEEDAAMLLGEVEEVQGYLAQGMIMWFDGWTEIIEEEECVIIALGTDTADGFIYELFYAVSPSGTIYSYDFFADAWNMI